MKTRWSSLTTRLAVKTLAYSLGLVAKRRLQHLLKQPKTLAAALFFLITLIFFVSRVVLPANHRHIRGFAAYYTASVLLVQGRLGPQTYDDEWFIRQLQTEIDQPTIEILTPTLPTVSVLALPLAFLSPLVAHTVWVWFNLVILLMALALLGLVCYQLSVKSVALWLSLAAAALLFPAVAANFNEDQAIILFFALFVITLWGLVKQRDGTAGVALGLAAILKTTGLSLWWLLPVQRRWRALIWGLGAMAGIGLLTLPWIGLDTWLAYLRAAGQVTGGAKKAVVAYQTTAGFLTHLFVFDATWNPNPLWDWPLLAGVLSAVVTVVGLGVTLWVGRRAAMPLFFAALAPLSVILLPVAEEHHFIVLLIPIFILCGDLLKDWPSSRNRRLEWSLFGLGLFLLVAPIPYESFSFRPGWWVFLAYPRLFGGWLIWLAAILRLFSYSNRSPALSPSVWR